MTGGLVTPVSSSPTPSLGAADRAFSDNVWRAPLVPAALALTAGVVLDRYGSVPLAASLVAVVVSVAAWAATFGRRLVLPPLVCLGFSLLALGAAYHHWHRNVFPEDDIGFIAPNESWPVHLYGELVEEPTVLRRAPERLRSFPRPEPTVAVLRVTFLQEKNDWRPVSGRVRLTVQGKLPEMHVGDRIAASGELSKPSGPANPGEFDYAGYLQDQRIRAQLTVLTPEEVVRVEKGWPWSLGGWLAVARGWGQQALQRNLASEEFPVADALLLGEGSPMTREDWEKYIRTGVIHVLAISGQHLTVLAVFLWGVLRLFGVRRRRGAWLTMFFLLGYALLAGGRPPVLRAAVMVCVSCGGIILRRPALSANSFALAWIVVAALNPADLFNTGCQLSFLAVAILFWGTSRWFRFVPDPLDQLLEESRPLWLRGLRGCGRIVAVSYAVTAVIWLALVPLTAARYHAVSPLAVVIGPPMVLLSSVALVAGFLLLLASLVCPPLAPLFAWAVNVSLAGCDFLVNGADRLPLTAYVGDVPQWWLWVFYPALLAVLMLEPLRRRGRVVLLAGLAWLCVGLIATLGRPTSHELRCTFLAVGHGNCTVIETPDGRTFLYDAGAMSGPDVVRRQIAPFLWSRGICRIDEIFLSHADLDHINGLPALLERFAVGQATCTPTFADKTTVGVAVVLEALQKHGVPLRIVRAGDRLSAGTVEILVLHPPDDGPLGEENVRSLVLLVRHEVVRHKGHTILLTGDLEKEGLERVLSLPPTPANVLLAPHHGSPSANPPELATWARPRYVIASRGPPRSSRFTEPYTAREIIFMETHRSGAVTVRSRAEGLCVETFQSGERFTAGER